MSTVGLLCFHLDTTRQVRFERAAAPLCADRRGCCWSGPGCTASLNTWQRTTHANTATALPTELTKILIVCVGVDPCARA
jgi:hypothetical protein